MATGGSSTAPSSTERTRTTRGTTRMTMTSLSGPEYSDRPSQTRRPTTSTGDNEWPRIFSFNLKYFSLKAPGRGSCWPGRCSRGVWRTEQQSHSHQEREGVRRDPPGAEDEGGSAHQDLQAPPPQVSPAPHAAPEEHLTGGAGTQGDLQRGGGGRGETLLLQNSEDCQEVR